METISDRIKKMIQAHLFRWIWAGLKAERELYDKKRIDDAMGE